MKIIVATHNQLHPDLWPTLPQMYFLLAVDNSVELDRAFPGLSRCQQEQLLLQEEAEFVEAQEQMKAEQELQETYDSFLAMTGRV